MNTQPTLDALRTTIRQHTHADEQHCVEQLLKTSRLSAEQREAIVTKGQQLVSGCRADSDKAGTLDVFMQEFSLSSKEGVALMCLAESLLRVPDAETADDLIAEKVLSGDWKDHLGQSDSLFVNASTWGLMLTGSMVRLESSITEDTDGWLKKLINRCGEPVIRTAVRQAMKIMGQQYVLGRDITEAIRRGEKENTAGTRFSFDMLGEGARTMADAEHYFKAYLSAIQTIGAQEKNTTVITANGISVKLSALHPRYSFSQRARVINELLPSVQRLAVEAKKYNLGFSIDAEEADRLDLSLDIFEALVRDPQLANWQGLGFVLQAYGKRAPWVSDWLIRLAKDTGRQLMVRLVKGAYWDTEIKYAQEQGYAEYPVYTRKANTDLSYQVCAEKLLQATDNIYPQFATHNAHTAALVMALVREAGIKNNEFEFQRLHGMGDLLHRQLAKDSEANPLPVRVYAPVGAHQDLLPYLVRRLLENGANSSFVNRFMDKNVPVQQVITDVQQAVESNTDYRHSAIPLPKNIFYAAGEPRPDTHGIDLANKDACGELLQRVKAVADQRWVVGPIIGGKIYSQQGAPVTSPADTQRTLGTCRKTDKEQALLALGLAHSAQPSWDALGGDARAKVLGRAADLMQQRMPELIGLISYEAGRTVEDGIAEVREAVDFLRYYAMQVKSRYKTAKNDKQTDTAQALKGRGVLFCISPWNFPLAIFTGQIAAALAAGNSVLAKPADQTPIVAAEAVKLLHQAGVPADVLHLIPGSGSTLGSVLNTDARINGVVFTGSTGVAQNIHKTLTARATIKAEADIPGFIAETGGQNVMVVDSSALPEQVVDDVIRSAFLSAGQRCSALRVLYVQDEIADDLITMLKGAMDQLRIGKPWHLNTDIGPVIDSAARNALQLYIDTITQEASLLHACQLPQNAAGGSYIAPQLIELDNIHQLPGEIFGPVLHLIRYKKTAMEKVIADINATGFGLTLGVHSRIEAFADSVVKQTRVGNNYINRNMVGAVVGVNPFGGQGLSGTGPKAGGPHYLSQFFHKAKTLSVAGKNSHERAEKNVPETLTAPAKNSSQPITRAYGTAERHQLAWDLLGGKKRSDILHRAAHLLQQETSPQLQSLALTCQHYAQQAEQRCAPGVLPGPTGETNQLTLHGRGIVFCSADDSGSFQQLAQHSLAALTMGNAVVIQPSAEQTALTEQWLKLLYQAGVPVTVLHSTAPDSQAPDVRQSVIKDARTAVVAWTGTVSQAMQLQAQRAAQDGAIIPFILSDQSPDYLLRFAVEKTVTINIVATGGNALLLNLDETDTDIPQAIAS